MVTSSVSRETLNVPEAAAKLGVSRRAAVAEISATNQLAGIPVIRVGRRVLVPRAPLDRLLDGQQVATETGPEQ